MLLLLLLLLLLLFVFVSRLHVSYIVVKKDSVGEGPASLYELEFTVDGKGEAIDESLAYLAER